MRGYDDGSHYQTCISCIVHRARLDYAGLSQDYATLSRDYKVLQSDLEVTNGKLDTLGEEFETESATAKGATRDLLAARKSIVRVSMLPPCFLTPPHA